MLITLAFRQKASNWCNKYSVAGKAASLYLVEKTHVTRVYFCTSKFSGLLVT